MFAIRRTSAGRSEPTRKPEKASCKFCQRSRWLMVVTILVVLSSITLLNNP